MPFTLQHSGTLAQVLSAAKTEAEKQHKALGDNAVAKAGLDKVNRLLSCLRTIVTELPDDSDAGLILTGDAGEHHLSISNLVFSASKPVAPADLEAHPVPNKEETTSNWGVPVKDETATPPNDNPTDGKF